MIEGILNLDYASRLRPQGGALSEKVSATKVLLFWEKIFLALRHRKMFFYIWLTEIHNSVRMRILEIYVFVENSTFVRMLCRFGYGLWEHRLC